jgi:hypothetical protein
LAQKKAAIAEQILLELAKRVLNHGAPQDHHIWGRLQSMFHARKGVLVHMPGEVAVFGLGVLRL